MKKCQSCGSDNHDTNLFCVQCGTYFDDKNIEPKQELIIADKTSKNETKDDFENESCPKCDSKNIIHIRSESSDFKAKSACCGYLLFGPLGLLCGMVDNEKVDYHKKCNNCGHEFE